MEGTVTISKERGSPTFRSGLLMISALQTFQRSHVLCGMQNSLVWGEFCFPKNKTMTFNSEFLQGLDEIMTGKTRMAVHVNYFRNS